MRCSQVVPADSTVQLGDVVPVRVRGRDWPGTVQAITQWGDGLLVDLVLPQEALELLALPRPEITNVERVSLTLTR